MTLENLFLFTAGSGIGAGIVYLYINLKNYKKVATKEAKRAIEKATNSQNAVQTMTANQEISASKNTNTGSLTDKTMMTGLAGLASFTTAANMKPSEMVYPDNRYTRLEYMFD